MGERENNITKQFERTGDAPRYRIDSFFSHFENGQAKYATLLFIITVHEKNKISIEKKFIYEIGDFVFRDKAKNALHYFSAFFTKPLALGKVKRFALLSLNRGFPLPTFKYSENQAHNIKFI